MDTTSPPLIYSISDTGRSHQQQLKSRIPSFGQTRRTAVPFSVAGQRYEKMKSFAGDSLVFFLVCALCSRAGFLFV